MSLANNSKFFNKRNFVAWFYRKLFTMTRKFNPENLNFLGTCFSLVSHSEQFSKNFCSVNSSLLLKQHSFNSSNSRYLSVFIRVICWRLPLLRMDFLRPQGAILYYILSSLCLPVGWWDCLLGALKAHEETSAHDYQVWLQARPIREDIKKSFYLLIY